MKNIKRIFIFISLSFFGSSAFLSEGIAVIDYNAIFLGTDLARERIDDLRDSSDYKDLTDEAQSKDSERIKLAEKIESIIRESVKPMSNSGDIKIVGDWSHQPSDWCH